MKTETLQTLALAQLLVQVASSHKDLTIAASKLQHCSYGPVRDFGRDLEQKVDELLAGAKRLNLSLPSVQDAFTRLKVYAVGKIKELEAEVNSAPESEFARPTRSRRPNTFCWDGAEFESANELLQAVLPGALTASDSDIRSLIRALRTMRKGEESED